MVKVLDAIRGLMSACWGFSLVSPVIGYLFLRGRTRAYFSSDESPGVPVGTYRGFGLSVGIEGVFFMEWADNHFLALICKDMEAFCAIMESLTTEVPGLKENSNFVSVLLSVIVRDDG